MLGSWYPVLSIIVGICGIAVSAQKGRDRNPLTDFCRLFGHATAEVDRKLFIDGGLFDSNPISGNKYNLTSTYLLHNDLNVTFQGMPQLVANSSKNASIPSVSGGILWADDVNKFTYQFGGELSWHASSKYDVFPIYDVFLDKWNVSTLSDDVRRTSWGAGVSVNERGEGYYLGGWNNNRTNPGWRGNSTASSDLIRYDMATNTFLNSTGPNDTGRAEGVMVFIPASDSGLLIHFGGVLDPFRNGTMVGSQMDIIDIYDMASTKWYTQKATGDVPDMRRRFCGGATWADDNSSWNVYIYGGLGIPPNGVGFDDVYILSMPSFTWVKWWPTEPGPGRPHHSMTCNVINRSQMLIIGGTFPTDDNCDSPDVWGTHNLNLGGNGPGNSKWDLFYPNISTYSVPPELIAQIGGGPSGGATVVKPQQWDNRDLSVYFSRVAKFPPRKPIRELQSTNAADGGDKKKGTGIIVGSAVGGFVALIVLLSVVFCWIRSCRQKRIQEPSSKRTSRAELPTSRTPELHATPMRSSAKPSFEAGQKAIPNYYYSQNSTKTPSPASSPHAPSPGPNIGMGTMQPVFKVEQLPPSDRYPPPAGVYPLGPYYHESSPQSSQSSRHPVPVYFPPEVTPSHQPYAAMTNHPLNLVPAPIAYGDLIEEDRTSQSPTPAYFYPQPLNVVKSQSHENMSGRISSTDQER